MQFELLGCVTYRSDRVCGKIETYLVIFGLLRILGSVNLGKRRDPNVREVSSLLVSYKIAIS